MELPPLRCEEQVDLCRMIYHPETFNHPQHPSHGDSEVPEPSTFMLVAMVLMAASLIKYRK